MTIIAACMMAVCIITATVLMHLINLVLQDQTQQYLGEISNQCRATIEKQIEGDLLTVQAASAFFDETLDEETIVSRLQAENNRNPFVRMAFVNRDYQATIVDLDGSIYLGQDVSDQPVVQRAMAGELSLSDIGSDRFSADDVVIYATPVTNNAQEIIGVMTASRKVDSSPPSSSSRFSARTASTLSCVKMAISCSQSMIFCSRRPTSLTRLPLTA